MSLDFNNIRDGVEVDRGNKLGFGETVDYCESEYKLESKILSKTSSGVLSKGWYIDQYGNTVMVKGNTKHSYEPYAEVITSIVMDILDIPHIRYYLGDKSKFREIRVNGGVVKHVSICKKYDIEEGYQVLPLYKFLKLSEGIPDYVSASVPMMWDYTKRYINLDELKTILVLDAYFANRDRHLYNIEVKYKGVETVRLVIPFDFGASLGLTVPLIGNSYGKVLNSSKPFKSTHTEQIALINKYSDFKLKSKYSKHEFLAECLKMVESTIEKLPMKRQQPTRDILTDRVDILDNIIEWR